jgi:TonB family protein
MTPCRSLCGYGFLPACVFALLIVTLLSAAPTIAQSVEPTPKRTSSPSRPKVNRFTDLKVHYKPAAGYTEAARDNRIQGTVKLLVVFLSTGQIGDVTVLTTLPHGLTERAVEAAKGIRFSPKKLNGVAMDESTTVEYSFKLFYDNDGDDVRTPVEIFAVPRVGITAADLPPSMGGKLSVKVFFPARGNASIYEYPLGISDEVRAKIESAVQGIKFNPGVHLSGNRANVVRTIQLDL